VIPSIETIVGMLIAGKCTKEQAIGWLNDHLDMARAAGRRK
jgi:hypothetical protein